MLLSVAAALVLAAQPNSPWLDEARSLVEQLRFSDAITRLEVARQVRSLEPGELRQVLELLAYCQVAEGRRDAAEATYTTMLQADPSLQLSRESSSPKVLEVLEAAKKKLFPPDYVRLEEQPSPAGRVSLRLIDPWSLVREVVLFERRDGGEWRETVLNEEGHQFRFALTVSGELEWYVEARVDENPVHPERSRGGSIASREEPRVLKVTRQASVAFETPKVKGTSGARVVGFVVMGLGVALGAVATGLEVNGWGLRQSARDRSRAPGDFADTAQRAERDGLSQQTWATGLFIAAGVSAATGVVLAW